MRRAGRRASQPPRLNVELHLETPDRQPDGIGGHEVIWRTLGSLWAAMDSGSGREKRAQVGPTSTVTWMVTVRGAPTGDVKRPRPDQRFRLGARVFRIHAVAEADGAGRYLICHTKEEHAA